MIFPEEPKNEKNRLAEVKKYEILDTKPEEDFDNITSLIATICEAPIALITILDKDRNFLKSHFGIDDTQVPRKLSLCAHAILEDKPIFIVENFSEDPRFKDNPSFDAQQTQFYAGAKLINENGFALGTLCILDTKPRKINAIQQKAMLALAKQVVNLLELRKKNHILTEVQQELEMRNDRLNTFANVVSHDLKSPLANITSLTRLLREENEDRLNKDSLQYLEYIEESSLNLKNYINGILLYYKADKLLEKQNTDVSFKGFFNNIEELLITKDIEFTYPKEGVLYHINEPALTQIILNLVDNASKYNDKDLIQINISYTNEENHHRFEVSDNGIGIDLNKSDEIFKMFSTVGIKDRTGHTGTGIGLATVKSLVNKLGGEITLNSTLGKGSKFTFTIKK